jgi:hypothetical protein
MASSLPAAAQEQHWLTAAFTAPDLQQQVEGLW